MPSGSRSVQYHSVECNTHIGTGTVCDKLQLRVQFIHLIQYNYEINIILQLIDRLNNLQRLYIWLGKGLELHKSGAVIFKAKSHTRTQLFSIT